MTAPTNDELNQLIFNTQIYADIANDELNKYHKPKSERADAAIVQLRNIQRLLDATWPPESGKES